MRSDISSLQQATMGGSRLCKNDGQETARAAALADIDEHLDNLKRCIHWLIACGIAVISVDMRRGKDLPEITVAASPWLHILFRDDCANVGRRQQGSLTIYPWVARRLGCVIRWDEVTA